MKINLNAIVTREQLEKMGIEKYMEISKKGKMERNYIIDHLPTITENILPRKAHEISFTSARNKELSNMEKNILTSLITYSNSEVFCNYLSQEFSKDELIQISKILTKYVNITKTCRIFNKDVNLDLSIFDPIISRADLIHRFTVPSIYLNRLNGILVYESELLDNELSKKKELIIR